MARVRLVVGSAMDVGKVREVNQDAFLAAPPLFLVADGMGGHQAGEVASAIAVEEFERADTAALVAPTSLDGARLIILALESAQQRIVDYATEQGAVENWYAGTTAVAAMLVHDDNRAVWLIVNLGDSRAYCYAEGHLEQVTVDHSLVQELVASGRLTQAQAATHPQRNIVTRALGGPATPDPDVFQFPASPGTRLLLCTDGISGMISDAEIAQVLAEVPDAQEAADRLVAEALAAGGVDNATAVVVDTVVDALSG